MKHVRAKAAISVEPGGFWADGFFSSSLHDVVARLIEVGWSRRMRFEIRRGDDVLGRMTLAEVLDAPDEFVWWAARPAMLEVENGTRFVGGS
jgi:hypothetical protein